VIDDPIDADLEAVVRAIRADFNFDRVRLQIGNDPHGLVAAVSPDEHRGLSAGDEASFTVTFRGTVPATDADQVFLLDLNVLTDEDDLADSKKILVVVPGRTVGP
jgi:hypothetical protein